jgi:hypothetical protein
MEDSADNARHYHDLAFEFLVRAKFATDVHVRDNYRKLGRYYAAKAGAEIDRAKNEHAAAVDRVRGCP